MYSKIRLRSAFIPLSFSDGKADALPEFSLSRAAILVTPVSRHQLTSRERATGRRSSAKEDARRRSFLKNGVVIPNLASRNSTVVW